MHGHGRNSLAEPTRTCTCTTAFQLVNLPDFKQRPYVHTLDGLLMYLLIPAAASATCRQMFRNGAARHARIELTVVCFNRLAITGDPRPSVHKGMQCKRTQQCPLVECGMQPIRIYSIYRILYHRCKSSANVYVSCSSQIWLEHILRPWQR